MLEDQSLPTRTSMNNPSQYRWIGAPESVSAAASTRDLWNEARRARADFVDLREALGQTISIGQALVRSRLREQPYATLVTAVAVGYVLGGGLPPVALAGALRLGGRMASGVVFTQLLRAVNRLADNA